MTISSTCNVGNAIIAANSHLAVEGRPSDEVGRSKWKHVPRQMPDALDGCLCGIVVDSQSDSVLECKKLGCETQWVRLSIFHTKKVLYHSPTFKCHLGCVLFKDIVPQNWVCEACEASGTSRGTKQSR